MGLLTDTNEISPATESVPRQLGKRERRDMGWRLVLGLLAVIGVMVWAVGCGSPPDEGIRATPTPVPTIAPGAVNANDVQAAVAAVLAARPQPTPGPSAEEIARMVAASMSEESDRGMSAEEIQDMIQQAVAAAVDSQPQPEGLTAADVQAIVTHALAAQPTPPPTAAPAPTPAAAATSAPAAATPAPARATPAPTATATPAPTPATQPREAELMWSYETEGEVHSSPAVSEEWDVLYIGSDEGYLYALDLVTSELLWRYNTGASRTSILALGKTVIVGTGNPPSGTIALESGQRLWKAPPSGWQGCSGPSTTAQLAAKPVVYTAEIYGVCALDATTGELLWDYSGNPVHTSPAVSEDTVYFGSDDNRLYALNAKKGELLWSYATNNAIKSSPDVVDGVVYIGSNDDHLYAVSAETGEFMWRYRTGGDVISSPAVANGIVYVGSNDGSLYALDAKAGTLAWKYETGDGVESSPSVADGVVYVGSNDGFFYALNAESGALVWSYETDDAVVSSPAVSGDMVYVGSLDGKVYAFRK